jgi:hypothetical protein
LIVTGAEPICVAVVDNALEESLVTEPVSALTGTTSFATVPPIATPTPAATLNAAKAPMILVNILLFILNPPLT